MMSIQCSPLFQQTLDALCQARERLNEQRPDSDTCEPYEAHCVESYINALIHIIDAHTAEQVMTAVADVYTQNRLPSLTERSPQ